MSEARFRFYEELNDYLPEKMRKEEIAYHLSGPTSVKEALESLRVPPDEVDLILVNGVSVDFSCVLEDGDRVSVYPIFEAFDISGVTKVRDRPLRETRLVSPDKKTEPSNC
jgi:hypothetical protein